MHIIDFGHIPKKTLVAYATRYGSTREVAEYLATILKDSGHSVDVRPMRESGNVEEYSNFVLGSPFYMRVWHKDMDRFLEQHEATLLHCPVAVFALGLDEAHDQLDRELERHPWLVPVATKMFGGKYDPAKLSFSHRLLRALPASPLNGLPATDLRDWSSIRNWTKNLADSLHQHHRLGV
jgi:menaquinone-dependent protoporphyrinogen oxidase